MNKKLKKTMPRPDEVNKLYETKYGRRGYED